MTNESINTVKKLTVQNIILNIILSVFKIITGFLTNSYSLFTDGINSISGIASLLISFARNKIFNKAAEEEQQQKHTEIITALILGIIIAILSVLVGIVSFFKIIQTIGYADDSPEIWAIPAVIAVLLIKGYMYINAKNEADEIKATSLLTVANDFKMDIFLSVTVLLGLISTYLFDFYMESIIAFCIAAVILKSADDVIKNALSQLINKSVTPEVSKNIKNLALDCDGVLNITDIKARRYANKIYIDMSITVDKNLSLKQCYNITENVQKKIKNNLRGVNHCMVQVDL